MGDYHLISQLYKALADPSKSTYATEPQRGHNNVLRQISPIVKQQQTQRLGIVVNANDDLHKHWKDVTLCLKEAVVERVPALPAATVEETIAPRRPRIGVWLMPDNRSDGEFEDFVARMIRGHDQLFQRCEEFVESIRSLERRFPENKSRNAAVQFWTSIQKAPGKMGKAVASEFVDRNAPVSKRFFERLSELFGMA